MGRNSTGACVLCIFCKKRNRVKQGFKINSFFYFHIMF
jgi:hypothetical protein